MINPSLYFSINTFSKITIQRMIDYYTPLDFNFLGYQNPSSYEHYVNFDDSKNLTEVLINKVTGKIYSITVVSSNNIKFIGRDFVIQNYLTKQMGLALNFNFHIPYTDYGIAYFTIKEALTLEVYDNAVAIMLPKKSEARFLFYHSEAFGVLTDKDFNVTGFVTWNLGLQEKNELLEYAKSKNIDTTAQVTIKEKMEPIVSKENQKHLIKKILELKNIEIPKVLYYGLKKGLIDNTFCIDFAYASIELTGSKDSLVLELAGLLQHEAAKVEEILLTKIKNPDGILVEQGPFYNKAWFYLTLATEACALNIID